MPDRLLRIAPNGDERGESAVTVSAGAADAGRIAALAADGKLDASVLREVLSTGNGDDLIRTGTAYTLALEDAGRTLNCTNLAPITLTVPHTNSVNWPGGTTIYIFQGNTGQVSIVGEGVVVVMMPPAKLPKTKGQYSVVRLRMTTPNWWMADLDLEDTTSFVTVGPTAGYPNERILTAGPGLALTDAGAGGALSVRVASAGGARSGTTYTPVLTDAEIVLAFTNAAGCVITIPAVTNVPYASGTTLRFLQYVAAGPVTVVGDLGVSIRVPAGKTAGCRGAWSLMVLTQEGTSNAWNLSGDLADATSYLTLAATASHVNERILTAGAGLNFTDAGAGAALTARVLLTSQSVTTTPYTLTLANAENIIRLSNVAAMTVIVPNDTSLLFAIGTKIRLTQTGAGSVTVAAEAGNSVVSPPGLSLSLSGFRGVAILIKLAANSWFLTGDLSPQISAIAGAAYTLDTPDVGGTLRLTAAAGCTVTVPSDGTEPLPIGSTTTLIQAGAGQVTVSAAALVTLNIPAGFNAKTRNQFSKLVLTKTAADTWSLNGELESTSIDASALALPSYLTLAPTSTLANERVLTQGTNVTLVDNPVAGTLTINASASPGQLGVNSPSGTSYILALTDAGKIVNLNQPTPVTLTVPTNTDVPFAPGTLIYLSATGLGLMSVIAAGGVSLVTPQGRQASVLPNYGVARLIYYGGNSWIIEGDLTDTTKHITLEATARFPNERVLTAGTGFTFTDGGPGGALTLNLAPDAAPDTVSAFSAYDLNQTLTSSSSATTLLVPTAEHMDQTGAFAAGVYTIPAAGVYTAICTARLWGSAGPNGILLVEYTGVPLSQPWCADSTGTCTSSISFTFNAAAGATIRFYARQDSGVSRSITGMMHVYRLSSGAPTAASYLTLAANAGLTNERVLTAGAGVAFADAGAGGALTVRASTTFLVQSGTAYTTVLGDAGNLIEFTNAAGCVVTIPNDSTLNYPLGTTLRFLAFNATGVVSVIGALNVVIRVPSGRTAATRAWYSEIVLKKEGTNGWNISGDLANNTYKARATGSGQAIANTLETVLAYSAETYDTNNNFAANAYTVPITGYYEVSLFCSASLSVANTPVLRLRQGGAILTERHMTTANAVFMVGSLYDVVLLTAGSVIDTVIQLSAGTATTNTVVFTIHLKS